MKTKAYNSIICTIAFLLFSIIFSLHSMHSMAQQKDLTEYKKRIFDKNMIFYDFRSHTFFSDSSFKYKISKPLLMKEGSEVRVTVSGFNPLRYSLSSKDTAFDRFEPNIENFNSKIAISSICDSAGNTEGIDSTVFLTKTNRLNKALTADEKEKGKAGCIAKYLKLSERIDSISRVLQTTINKYSQFVYYIENINSFYESVINKPLLSKKDIDLGIMELIIKPLSENITEDSLLFKKLFPPSYIELINCEKKHFEQILNIKAGIILVSGSISKTNSTCSNPKVSEALLKSCAKLAKDISRFDSSRSAVILPRFEQTMVAYKKLTEFSTSDGQYITMPISIDKDIQSIFLYKYDKISNSKECFDKITIKMTRGFRIGVSGGLFVSGLYDGKFSIFSKDSLYKTQYLEGNSLKDTTLQGKFSALYQEPNVKASFGGMIFLQAHSQNDYWLNYGFYVGVGALFNDQTRWCGSMGISAILGRNHRAFLNVGPIISQVDRLGKPYNTDQFYLRQFDAVPITKLWKASWMFGFSWKIGK